MQENNGAELERLDKERHADFLSMLKGFVASQVISLLSYMDVIFYDLLPLNAYALTFIY